MCARTKTGSKVVTHLFVLPGTESALKNTSIHHSRGM